MSIQKFISAWTFKLMFFLNKEYKYPTENKAAYSRIILLIKKCVFTGIMAVYDIKDSVSTCKTRKHMQTLEN